MSFLDQDEALIDLAQQIQLVYSPIVDVKVFPEDVDVTLVEGAVANEDQEELLKFAQSQNEDSDFVRRLRRDWQRYGSAERLERKPSAAVLNRAYVETADVNPQIPN